MQRRIPRRVRDVGFGRFPRNQNRQIGMNMLVSWRGAALIITSLSCAFFSFASSSGESADDGFAKLVEWMTNHGGRVHPGIRVATRDGIRGVFAASSLDDGEEISFCPWRLTIGSNSFQDQMNAGNMCKAVLGMAHEMRLASDSLWFPYLSHIELPRLPAVWDAPALEELQGLAPRQDAARHVEWFQQTCNGGGPMDRSATRSLVAFITRASEVGMVPIYDLLNHHNGRRNAKLKVEEDGVHLHVVGGPVRKDEQLYISYGIKPASDMYRDYGFVEEWPTFYNFPGAASGDNFAFVSLPGDTMAVNPTTQFLKGVWNADMSLAEYQASARSHMETLPDVELMRFANAAREYLGGLPTTPEEDAIILEDKIEMASRIRDDDGSSSNLDDVVSAVGYRRAFKYALEKAAISCEDVVKSRANASTRGREL